MITSDMLQPIMNSLTEVVKISIPAGLGIWGLTLSPGLVKKIINKFV